MASINPYTNPISVYNKPEIDESKIYAAPNVYNENFYKFLIQIQNQNNVTIREIPNNVDRIPVDLNTRKILIEQSAYKDFLSIEKDHRAEIVYFEVDRYYEDIDLSTYCCIVEYLNAAPAGEKKLRIYPITLMGVQKVLDGNTGQFVEKLLLAWNLGNEATEYAGTIEFSLIFYRMAYDFNESGYLTNCRMTYALHTAPQKGTILHGMHYTQSQELESDMFYTVSPDNYTTLWTYIQQNKDPRWINV